MATSLVPTDRRVPARLAIGALCGCALIAVVDPNEGGRYPACPTQALLGLDCPACGTLRGLHALSRGRLGQALDHNVLLVAAVPIGLLLWWGWVRAAVGRPAAMPLARWASSRWAGSRWLVPAVVVLATAFTVARNLPLDPLAWLDSAA